MREYKMVVPKMVRNMVFTTVIGEDRISTNVHKIKELILSSNNHEVMTIRTINNQKIVFPINIESTEFHVSDERRSFFIRSRSEDDYTFKVRVSYKTHKNNSSEDEEDILNRLIQLFVDLIEGEEG